MHSCTQNNDVSLAKEFQTNISKEHHKHVVIYLEKYRKRDSKLNWKEVEYHTQGNANVAHKDVNLYYKKNQFPELAFYCSRPKPHGARELSKHYHLPFDPKTFHGICAILRIPCGFVACTSMIDQPWISGIT